MEVEATYGDQVTFVGIPGLSDVPEMAAFIDDTNTGGIAHIADQGAALWKRFDVFEQRTYIYINDDGTFERSGYGSLEANVQDLIAR